MSTVTITSTIKEYPKRHPYQAIKDAILGKKYDLSLVFVGSDRAATLNKEYRKKDYVPNILSFPLADNAGEIVICPHVANREAKKFNLTPNKYIAYLFIHGCVHLTGLDHGLKMDKLEAKYRKKFNIV